MLCLRHRGRPIRRSARKWLRRLGARWVGVGLTVAASFWAGYNFNHWTGRAPAPVIQTGATAPASERATRTAGNTSHSTNDNTLAPGMIPGTIYVRRDGSVLRDEPEWSARTLAHKNRGAAVALLKPPHDGWAKVRDGDTVGWMRASILGDDPTLKTAGP